MSSRSVFHCRRSWVNILQDLLTAVLELKSIDIAGRWDSSVDWTYSFSPDHVNSLKKVIAESSEQKESGPQDHWDHKLKNLDLRLNNLSSIMFI